MAKIEPGKPEVSPYAAEMYEAACRARASRQARNYLGMSAICGPCDRALWLDFRGYPKAPFDGRMLLLFELGDIIENQMISWLKAAGYNVEGQQKAFEAHHGFFRGHCDGIVHGITKRPHILEIKSANDNSFKAFKKLGVRAAKPLYWGQMQCYMGYSNLERAFFLVSNKNTSELYTERVYFDQDAFESLHERAGEIIYANDPPKRSKDCTWCNFTNICDRPHATMFTSMSCGVCAHFHIIDRIMLCQHPLHPHEITADKWGTSCPEIKIRQFDDVSF